MTQTLPAPQPTSAAPAPAPQAPAQERRIGLRAITPDRVLALVGSAAAALGLTWVVYERILPLTGALAFWILWYVLFLLAYASVTAMIWGRRAVTDRIVGTVMYSVGFAIVLIILDQIGYTVFRGG